MDASQNVEDKGAPPVDEKVKLDEVQPTENIESVAAATNGEATPEQTGKPAAAEAKEEAPKAVEEASEPEEMPAEEKREDEPVLEAASKPVAAVNEATTEIEESSKEVRTEEVPPPLPSSNPPSPVTVFAESTKAEAALTSGQVPREVQEPVESSVLVPVDTKPPKTEDLEVLETPVVSKQISAVETVAEPSPPALQDSVPEPLPPSPPSPVPEKMESLACLSGPIVIVKLPKPIETKEIPDPSPSIEDLPPAPPSPIPEKHIDSKPESAPAIIDSVPVTESTPNLDESLPVVDLEPIPVVEPLPVVDPEPLPITKSSQLVAPEHVPIVESSPVVDPELVANVDSLPVVYPEPVPIIESSPLIESEHVPIVQTEPEDNVKPDPVHDSIIVEASPGEPELISEAAPAEATNAESEPTKVQLGEELKTKIESELNQSVDSVVSEGHVEPSTPPSTPAANSEIPATELAIQSVIPASSSLDISEPVVATADSLPDISTESLPSLPELLSESLAPMSLPPVDSVPEPIAPSSEPTSQEEPLIPPPVAPLTNGNVNGHSSPSPVEEENQVLETEVPGPTKQVVSDQAKESEISPEADDNPRETAPAVVPAVEE
ncbi:unnamed protein product [Ceutorhynchus assimilis]|uniref:Uncharacterized protein n=1 Tax=Ceutorhynchus assimilis TaxID=467358 RepID=A0A9P0DGZ9_9CUCU|nr:unnamed protein product [Ceutorhynchus assimilis]